MESTPAADGTAGRRTALGAAAGAALAVLGWSIGRGLVLPAAASAAVAAAALALLAWKPRRPHPTGQDMALVVRTAPFPSCLCGRDGRITCANQEFAEFFGLELASMSFRRLDSLFVEAISLSDLAQGQGGSFVCHTKSGRPARLEVRMLHPFDEASRGWMAALLDVPGAPAPSESSSRTALLCEATRMAKVGGWELDASLRNFVWTDEVAAIIGMPGVAQMPVEEALQMICPEHRERIEQVIKKALTEGGRYLEAYSLKDAKGNVKWVEVLAKGGSENGRPRLYGAIQDVTEGHARDEELVRLARTDPLTGLWTRTEVLNALAHAAASPYSPHGPHCALIIIDMDRFKSINDSLGHQVGDHVLQQSAERIRSVLLDYEASFPPAWTMAGRFGGDEFLVALINIPSVQDSILLGHRILDSLSRPIRHGRTEVFVGASIGVASRSEGTANVLELVRDADAALYQAKHSGRSRMTFCTEKMREKAAHRLETELDLRRGLEEGQFFLVYQPVMSLGDGSLLGFEALIRWMHPRRGVVLPAEFISIAQESGIIGPLGQWVIREACQRLGDWSRTRPRESLRHFAVNVDRMQLLDPRFAGGVLSSLKSCPGMESCLHIEITEDGVLQDLEAAVKPLAALREAGVKVDLDDFGTGRSSLSCLQELPIDVLKLDRSFLRSRIQNEEGREIVASILRIAKACGLTVLAEGIETPEQLAILQELGCPLGQGFLFSPPLPYAKAEAILADPSLVQGQWAVSMERAA